MAATLIVAASGVLLGQWQTRRGDQKEAMQARMSAREAAPALLLDAGALALDPQQGEYRRVRLRGQFLSAWTTYLDNRPYQGTPGFYVLTPFRIAGTDRAVLIERGWVQRDLNDRSKLPLLPPPAGLTEINGVLRLGAGHLLQLGTAAAIRPGAIMQNLDLAAFAQASGLRLLPVLIEQQADVVNAGDGLVRDWPPASLGIERHRGYAMQWYALALMTVVFFVVTGFRSGKK